MIEHYRAAREELTRPGGQFALTRTNVRGVDILTYAAAPPHMRVFWELSAAHGDKEYVVYEDEHYSYAQIHEDVRKLAAAFVAQGVQPGDRIALAMRNYPEWITGYWAGIAVGAAVVGMNAWWTPPEMEYALNDSEPRVLIADGQAGDRAALGVMLSGCGCDVALADNGPVALRLVHEAASRGTPFRVVVLDRDLAMLDGEELGRAIRSDRELDATELVMVTASGRVGDGARVRAAGFAAYLVKPFPATHLIEAITEVLHPSRAERPHGHAPLITRHSLAEARRSRLHLLLVDDDPVNQLVTTSALHRVGYTVEVAPTVARAVTRAAQQHWDLVLMNLPVSEADATRIAAALHTHAGAHGRTPLIGLTADRTTVVEGLDAVLRKPVRFEELGEVVERFTAPIEPFTNTALHGTVAGTITLVSSHPESDAVAHVASDEPPPLGEGPAIDLEQLENACMGIPALRATLMQTFLGDVQPRLERLADAFAAGEPERVEFEAHGLKGMCATLGANDCAELFATLEARARDHWQGDPQPWLEACRAEVARAEAFIRRFERIVAQPDAEAA